jgi:hypothetical protein
MAPRSTEEAMGSDWKRVKQSVFLSVLLLAAGAEVVANVMAYPARLSAEAPAIRVARESEGVPFAWCSK